MSNIINKTIPVTSLVAAARQLAQPANAQSLLEREYDLLVRRFRRGDKRITTKTEFVDGDIVNPDLEQDDSVTVISSCYDAKTGELLISLQHSTTGVRYVR